MRATSLILLSLLAMLVVTGSPAGASQMHANASGMSATVAPSTGLYDRQVVNLSWSGFPAGGPVYVEECVTGATNLDTQCVRPPGDLTNFVTGADGSGVVRYLIVQGPLGSFTCDFQHNCSLYLMTAPPDLTSGPHVQLQWAPPQGACPGTTGLPVGGEGASPAAYTMYAWEAAGCKTAQKLSVTYTNDNSYDGMEHFAAGFPGTNFAVTGVPMPSQISKPLAKKKHTFGYVPLTLTGVAIGYNIIDQAGHQIENLVLTPEILAEIATNKLSSFYCPPKVKPKSCINNYGSDPNIAALNPGVQFPTGSVQFFIRAEHSASNLAFSTWLSQNAGTIWTYGPTLTWPPAGAPPSIPPGTQGEANASHAVGFPSAYNSSYVYIGIMDTTDAAVNDLPVAKIVQPGVTSQAGVAPTSASLDAAVTDATHNADGTITPNYTTTDPNAYPIPMLTYAVVPTNEGWPHFTASDGKMLKAFLNYTATTGQSRLPAGSFPLPGDVATQAQAEAAKIPTTEPGTGGGKKHHGHGHGHGNGNGNGNTGNGSGSGTGTGTGTGFGGTGSGGTLPQTSNGNPPPSSSGGPPSTSGTGNPSGAGGGGNGLPKVAFATVGNIAAPSSSAVKPVLITLAILGLLIAPLAMLLSRRDQPFNLSSTFSSIKMPRIRR